MIAISKTNLVQVFALCMLASFLACGGSATTEETEETAPEPDTKTWQLVAYGPKDNPQPVAEGIEVTLQLDLKEGKIAGVASCNNYFGNLTDDAETYRFGPIGSTRKMCADEAVNAMETTYLKMMEKVTRMAFENSQLILDVEGGQQLVFEAS